MSVTMEDSNALADAEQDDDPSPTICVDVDPKDIVPALEPDTQIDPTAACTMGAADGDVGNNNGVWNLVTCRRRARNGGMTPAYRNLLLAGRSLSDEERTLFASMAWWSDQGMGKEQNASGKADVLVVVPRSVDGDMEGVVDAWKLITFIISIMHQRVVERNQPFSVVWVQAGDHRIWPWSAWSFRRSLHERYSSNLTGFHVVHPSWTVRLIQFALWPMVGEEFWDHFECHERVEFLKGQFDINSLGLPQDVFEHDNFLDQEAEHIIEHAALTGSYVGSRSQHYDES